MTYSMSSLKRVIQRRLNHAERGMATSIVAALLLIGMTCSLIMIQFSAAVKRASEAQNIADLAAIAGATTLRDTADPEAACGAVRTYAQDFDLECRVDGNNVEVIATSPSPLPLIQDISARALAGPGEAPSAEG